MSEKIPLTPQNAHVLNSTSNSPAEGRDVNAPIPGSEALMQEPKSAPAGKPEASHGDDHQLLEYLKNQGEDVSDLFTDLETVLGKDKSEATPKAPSSQPPQSAQEAALDPYNPAPQPAADPGAEPAPQPAEPDPQASTEAADGQDGDDEFSLEGEVEFDEQGRARDSKTGRYVPHQALHAERVKHGKTKVELEEAQKTITQFNERLGILNTILQAQEQATAKNQPQPKAEEPEAEIDPEQDIFGAFAQLAKRNKALEQQLNQTQQLTQQQVESARLQAAYRQDATRFLAENPDFGKAYEFLTEMRGRELEVLGYTDPVQRQNALAMEEKSLVESALRQKKSPSHYLYALAQAKGYKKSEPPVQPSPAPAPVAPRTNGQQPPAQSVAPAPAPAPQPNPAQPNPQAAQQIQQIQNGQNAAPTLSGAGGSGGGGLTVQQLANMSDSEFMQLAEKVGRKKLDALLAGF